MHPLSFASAPGAFAIAADPLTLLTTCPFPFTTSTPLLRIVWLLFPVSVTPSDIVMVIFAPAGIITSSVESAFNTTVPSPASAAASTAS